jgi:hypothetical protein
MACLSGAENVASAEKLATEEEVGRAPAALAGTGARIVRR